MRRLLPRPALALLIVLVASGAAAGSLAAKATPLRIAAPGRALQGKVVAISVKSQSFTCKLSVRFAHGDKQSNMPPTQVQSGKVVWQWQVPQFAPASQARLTVACPGAARRNDHRRRRTDSAPRRGGEEGLLVPGPGLLRERQLRARPAEHVAERQRVQRQRAGQLRLPDTHLIGTASATIPIINAGSQYDLGGEISFAGAPTISRLEIAINPDGSAKSAKSFSPALDNVHLVPSFDPAWLGSVEGDLINVNPGLTLDNSNMSCVVLDAEGNVVGGGLGAGSFKLLPGTRSFFKIAGGLDPIPFNKAASVAISILPQYESAAP